MSVDQEAVELVTAEQVKNIAYTAAITALTAALAYVAIPYPLSPAPVTLQVLGVFLAGIFLGPLWGAGAMVLYVFVGAVGLPVFAGGSAGIGYLRGPTGGYVLSYPVAAGIIGAVVHRDVQRSEPASIGTGWYVFGLTVGLVVIYGIGTGWMAAVQELALNKAILIGAIVFLPADLLKMAAAIIAARSTILTTPEA